MYVERCVDTEIMTFSAAQALCFLWGKLKKKKRIAWRWNHNTLMLELLAMVLVLLAVYTTAQKSMEVAPMPHMISAICHEEEKDRGPYSQTGWMLKRLVDLLRIG